MSGVTGEAIVVLREVWRVGVAGAEIAIWGVPAWFGPRFISCGFVRTSPAEVMETLSSHSPSCSIASSSSEAQCQCQRAVPVHGLASRAPIASHAFAEALLEAGV